MPLNLLKSAGADLVSHLEMQVRLARALTAVITDYHESRDPREVPVISQHLDQMLSLNGVTVDILFSADLALAAASQSDRLNEY